MNLRVYEAEQAFTLWKSVVVRARQLEYVVGALALFAIGFGTCEVRHPFWTFALFGLVVLAYVVQRLFANRAIERHREMLSAIRALHYGDDVSYAASRRILQGIADFESRRH